MNVAVKEDAAVQKGKHKVKNILVQRYRAGVNPLKIQESEEDEDFLNQITQKLSLPSSVDESSSLPVIADRRLARLSDCTQKPDEQLRALGEKPSGVSSVKVISRALNAPVLEPKSEVASDESDLESPEGSILLRVRSDYAVDEAPMQSHSEQKPLFISKKNRQSEETTVRENESLSHALLCSVISTQSNEQDKGTKESVLFDPNSVDDTDPATELEQDAEFKAWKEREKQRYIRQREQSDRIQMEKAQVEELRSQTLEQRQSYWRQREETSAEAKSQRTQYRFMQKYYHKGVFFQDAEAPVLQKDYDAPVQSDASDATVLPSIMQVKNFGKKGRSKWTHLVAEDTTMVSFTLFTHFVV